MSVTISIYKGCSDPLYLQLFVGEFMSYGRYLCLFANRGVQCILCCVFVFCLVLLPVFLNCPFFLIAISVFFHVYFIVCVKYLRLLLLLFTCVLQLYSRVLFILFQHII